ncbi:hypothetical protein BHE74_00014778 [Ensete ventricosum]|nr:hypothetical protein BHE74_00014778 [Ensete ventricosum]
MGLFSMPGNLCVSVGHAEAGSLSPPRHWSTKAKEARARGSTVRRRMTRDAKLEPKEDEAPPPEGGRRGAVRLGIARDRIDSRRNENGHNTVGSPPLALQYIGANLRPSRQKFPCLPPIRSLPHLRPTTSITQKGYRESVFATGMDAFGGFFVDEKAIRVENIFLEFLKRFKHDPNAVEPFYETEIEAMRHKESTTMYVDFSHVMRFNDVLQKAISEEYLR